MIFSQDAFVIDRGFRQVLKKAMKTLVNKEFYPLLAN